jgi:hypothetical protein
VLLPQGLENLAGITPCLIQNFVEYTSQVIQNFKKKKNIGLKPKIKIYLMPSNAVAFLKN